MASRLDHPTMSTETQQARALELARAAEARRRATEAHGNRRPDRAAASGLSSLIARLVRGAPADPEPCLCGRVPG